MNNAILNVLILFSTNNMVKGVFTLSKFVGKIMSNIADIIACRTYLGHTLQSAVVTPRGGINVGDGNIVL